MTIRRTTPVSVVRIARATQPQANPAAREVKATCPAFERARASVEGLLDSMSPIERRAHHLQVTRIKAADDARRVPAQLPMAEAA